MRSHGPSPHLVETALTLFLGALIMSTNCSRSYAAEPAWSLEKARARIRRHRMSDAVVELRLPDGSRLPRGTVVQVRQTEHAFLFGGSLTQAWNLHKHPKFEQYLDRFDGLFNYATLGFYWNWHERKEPGTWKLAPHTARMLKWSKERGMTVKGHPLMWHNCLPRFVADEPDVKKIDRYILDHVRMLPKTYPTVDQWDLYNETPGIRFSPPENGARRWVEAMGGTGPATKRLVDAVRQVRPEGFYMLNHFTHDDPEYDKQIAYCIDNEVRFDAIGVQTHMHTRKRILTEEVMWATLERHAAYGRPIHLSEVTILSSRIFEDWRELQKMEGDILAARRAGKAPPSHPSTPEGEARQAQAVADFYTLAFSHPAIEAIVWWSVTDASAWRGSAGGLVDENMNPKPAYEALAQLINEDWRTSEQLGTDAQGHVSFRGFHGDYSMTASHGGQQLQGSFKIEPGKPCRVQLRMEK